MILAHSLPKPDSPLFIDEDSHSSSYSSHQPVFQIAFQDRKCAREEVYTKGVSEGIHHQKEDETELIDEIERYRVEPNQARNGLFSLRAQLESTRAEWDCLRDKLRHPTSSTDVSPVKSSPPAEAPPEAPRLVDQQSTGTPVNSTPSLMPHHIATPASPQVQLPDCVAACSFAAVLSAGQSSTNDDPITPPFSDEQNVTQNW